LSSEKKSYGLGHRKPDSDSVISAAAYARLKQLQGQKNCIAARAGQLSPQTEYIFERFNAPVPEYIPDLIPKAAHYLTADVHTVHKDKSLWEAIDLMENENLRLMPVVDSEGRYQSMIYYRRFAQYIISHINPHHKASFLISLHNLVKTLNAKTMTMFDEAELRESHIIIAASYRSYFKQRLKKQNPKNALVIMGDRLDLQRYAIEQEVRALIISNDLELTPELEALAREKKVTVIISPYDTPSTAMMVMYSTPVSTVGDTETTPVRLTDPVRTLKERLSQAPSRGLPVLDDQGHVAGILFEWSLIGEPNIEIIMVDHNEPSQALEGIENFRIREIIDHHRLGNLSTRYPITFINRVVGATCTIIANLYREQHVEPEKEMASILLCGILTDTLNLQSVTATDTDRETAEWLSTVTGLNIQRLGLDIQAAANKVNDLGPADLIALDIKDYAENGVRYTVSQIETDNPQMLVKRQNEIFGELEKIRRERNLLFTGLLVTDVTALDSLFFVSMEQSAVLPLKFPRLGENIYILKDVVSRKKQLIPLLSEIVANTFFKKEG
jgi:manganese-dependent inorganic pyrophosphatase